MFLSCLQKLNKEKKKMRYDIFLIIAYWKKHKRQALSLLVIFIMLFSYLFISMSMVRTELRRIYFDGFYRDTSENGYMKSQSYGGYDYIIYDVKNSDFPELHDKNYIDNYASVFTCGYAGTDNYNYTAGYYPDDDAIAFAGYPFLEGKLPKNANEVAVSETALENMGMKISVGEKITLSRYNEKREKLATEDFTLCGILKDNGTNLHWDTNKRTNKPTDFYEPTMLFFPEVFNPSEVKESIMFNSDASEHITNSEQEDDFLTFLTNCFESSGSSQYNSGARDSYYFVRENLTSTEDTYMTDEDNYYKSPKSYLYQITGFGAALLMAITLCCGLFVILQERLKSFHLLWQVGLPLWRIRRMLIIECIGFTTIGLLLGFSISMIAYELILLIQKIFFGLEMYQTYPCEWGIQQITYSPILFSVLSVVIASVLSYSLPCLLLKRMLYPKQKKYTKSRFSSTLKSCLHKLFHSYKISIMQVISLVLVLSITSIALMFFSLRGKENVTNPQIIENGKFYETDIGINRKTLHVDCTIEDTFTTFSAGLLDLDINSGYTEEQYQKIIENNYFSTAYAWAEVYLQCFYPEEDTFKGKNTLPSIEFVEGEKEWYGLENQDVYNLPCALLVDNQMFSALFPNAELSDNSIYLIEKKASPFSKGDNLNLYSAIGVEDVNSSFYHKIIDTCQFTAEISDIASIEDFKENELLYTILSKQIKDNNWMVIIPTQTAEKNAFPRLNYEQIYLQYSKGTTDTDVKNAIRAINTPESSMSLKTISDCDKQYWNAMIQELVVAFTIFGLLLSLAMIGYLQTLKLQLIQKRKQLSILRMLGLSEKQTKKMIWAELIKIPIIAIPLSIATIWGIRRFLESQSIKAETISDFVSTQQYQTEEEAATLTQHVELLKHLFLTEYELWKVPVWGIFIGLALCILIIITINIIRQSKKTLKNLKNEEI